MTNDEQTPGTFSDGRTPPEDDFIEEQIAFAATKEDLIDNLLKTKSITPQYAFLLQSIQTATLGREGAILRKVQAVLALREALRQESIAKRLTLNILDPFLGTLKLSLAFLLLNLLTASSYLACSSSLRNLALGKASLISLGATITSSMNFLQNPHL